MIVSKTFLHRIYVIPVIKLKMNFSCNLTAFVNNGIGLFRQNTVLFKHT